jgi:hypothetical protein
MLRKRLMMLMFMLGASLWAVSGLAAQPSGSADRESQTDAMAVLMKMADFLSQAKQFRVSIRSGYDVLQETGQMIEFAELRNLTLVRPDRFRVDVERSDGEKVLVLFDGKELTVFSPNEAVFAKTAIPGDVDNAIRYLRRDLRLRLPLAMLFVTQFPAQLERRVRSVEIVEQNTLMDVPCVHLAARADQVDFQVWVPSEGDPLPRRIVITYKDEEGQPQFWADFNQWNLAPHVPDGFFIFTPPQGVLQIPFLAQLEVAKPDVKGVKIGDKK